MTPIVILLLGMKINRTLEAKKTSLSKDKEWLTKWAERFYSAAIDFNDAVEECIHELYWISYYSSKKVPEWECQLKEKNKYIFSIIEKASRSNSNLQTAAEFAPKHKDDVLKCANQAFNLLSALLQIKQGNIDEIRLRLFAFNKVAMAAHREILGE